jgi:hypothetical protein
VDTSCSTWRDNCALARLNASFAGLVAHGAVMYGDAEIARGKMLAPLLVSSLLMVRD